MPDPQSRPPAGGPERRRIPTESVETAQPPEEDGVTEDMATLAVNPGILEGVQAPATVSYTHLTLPTNREV